MLFLYDLMHNVAILNVSRKIKGGVIFWERQGHSANVAALSNIYF